MKKLFLFFVACAFIIPTSSFAATDGDIGETSQGSAVITLAIPALIVANGFDDITFDKDTDFLSSTDPNNYINSAFSRSAGICVASNNQGDDNKYQVTVSNNNNTGSNDYFVKNENYDDKVYFNLNFKDADDTAQDLVQNVMSTAEYTAHTSLTDCNSSYTTPVDNATYTITFQSRGGTTDRPSVDMVRAGVYVSTLTFLFTPKQDSSDY